MPHSVHIYLFYEQFKRHMMHVFLSDCLRFSKLLQLHIERIISSNLLKCKQSSKKTSCAANFTELDFVYTKIYTEISV